MLTRSHLVWVWRETCRTLALTAESPNPEVPEMMPTTGPEVAVFARGAPRPNAVLDSAATAISTIVPTQPRTMSRCLRGIDADSVGDRADGCPPDRATRRGTIASRRAETSWL